MRRTTLIVCENPWTDRQGNLEKHSVRPFVEGLCDLWNARLVFRTYLSLEELKHIVSVGTDRRHDRFLLYLASHGEGGRLVFEPTGIRANLASVAGYLNGRVESVWLGACDVAQSDSLKGFLGDSGAMVAGGYICSVRWADSLIVDLAVLQALLRQRRIDRTKTALDTLGNALRAFSPEWRIGESENGAVPLTGAIRVVARNRRARPRDITADIRHRLKWPAPST